jgi:hypothetical protein
MRYFYGFNPFVRISKQFPVKGSEITVTDARTHQRLILNGYVKQNDIKRRGAKI